MATMEQWSVAQVGEWLRFVKMDAYVDAFAAENVDGALLTQLDTDMLEELGIASKLQRRKLLIKRDSALRDNYIAADAPAPPPSSKPAGTTATPTSASSTPLTRAQEKAASERKATGATTQATKAGSAPTNDQEQYLAIGDLHAQRPARSASSPASTGAPAGLDDQDQYLAIGDIHAQRRAAAAAAATTTSDDAAYLSVGDLAEQRQQAASSQHNDTYMALASIKASKEPEAVRLGRMASVKVNAFQKAMEHLRNMFQDLPKSILEDALKTANCNVDKAVDEILSSKATAKDRAKHRVAKDQDQDWLHGVISRETAESLLSAFGESTGLFLVRRSTSVEGAFVLSLCADRDKLHHIIYPGTDSYVIFDIRKPTLSDLIEYLSDYQKEDGWFTPLTQHVPRTASAHLGLSESSIDRSRSSSVHTARSSAESRSHGAGAAGPVRSRSSPPAVQPGSKMATPSPSPATNLARHISITTPSLPATGQIEPYAGDKTFKAKIHIDSDSHKLGFPQRQVGRADCALHLTASGVEVLLDGPKGHVIQFVSYGAIDGADYTDSHILRLVIGDGPVGTYYFDCSSPKRVHERLVKNRARFLQLENVRIAQLVQSADFRGRLQQNPEFAAALKSGADDAAASGVDPYAPEAIYAAMEKNSKARAVLSRLARSLTINKRGKGKHPARQSRAGSGMPTASGSPLASHPRANEPLPPLPMQSASPAASGKPQDLPPPVPAAAEPYVLYDDEDDLDGDSPDDAWAEGVMPTYTQVVPSSRRRSGGRSAPADMPQGDDEGTLYEALESNMDNSPGALQFSVGDQILVTHKDPSGVWEGMCYGQDGTFRSSLVRPVVTDDDMEELDVDALTLSKTPPSFDAPHVRF